jgi:cytidylate kinase
VEAIPVICVDGPTASGKGTLAAVLAQRLGYHFLDSGSLYRITGLAALRAGFLWTPPCNEQPLPPGANACHPV